MIPISIVPLFYSINGLQQNYTHQDRVSRLLTRSIVALGPGLSHANVTFLRTAHAGVCSEQFGLTFDPTVSYQECCVSRTCFSSY